VADVFISYPRAARGKAEIIRDRLEALGIRCFFDMDKIDAGDNFPDVIDRALRASQAVICCWSPAYFESTWCMIECRDALEREIIVPVAIERFDRFAPPADLRQVNWFDLADWHGQADAESWARTLARLERLLGRDLTAAAPATERGESTPGAVASAAEQGRAELLADLRATWSSFPAKSDVAAVQRFLERVQAVAANSGISFEIEHHLDELRRSSERLAQEAAEAAAAREAREQAKREARRKADEQRARPGAIWRDAIPGMPANACPEMITVPSGRFLMGSPPAEQRAPDYDGREEPQHEVRIAHRYALGNYPVTFADWDAAIAVGARLERPVDEGWGRRRVIGVSWNDAHAYIDWLNGRLGLRGREDAYRLPSEAEWEYACRAGSDMPYSWGESIAPSQAHFSGASAANMTRPVGSFPANAFMLHDMHGNVLEWCEDAWNADYGAAERPDDGAPWLGGNTSRRVLRGGSWQTGALQLRSASRFHRSAMDRANDTGFRLARTLPPAGL
jgi:formylglycine-generating enzyme required for sulfatase activity